MRMRTSTQRKNFAYSTDSDGFVKKIFRRVTRWSPRARATRGLLGKRGVLAPRGRAGENGKQATVGRAQ
jgi:hypothetical protein